MLQNECTNKLLNPIINFNLLKKYYFSIFYEHKNTKLNHFTYFKNEYILGCYKSTALK